MAMAICSRISMIVDIVHVHGAPILESKGDSLPVAA
jgi:hypothetical protein